MSILDKSNIERSSWTKIGLGVICVLAVLQLVAAIMIFLTFGNANSDQLDGKEITDRLWHSQL